MIAVELGKDVLCLGCGEIAEGEGNVAEDGGVAVVRHCFAEGDDIDSGAAEGAVGGELEVGVGVVQQLRALGESLSSEVG